MKYKFYILLIELPLLLMGCLPDTSGIDPPNDKLIYPVGLAVLESEDTEADRFLAVANSNFDLNYNSGTLVAVNLTTVYEIIDDLRSNSLDSSFYQDKMDWFNEDLTEIHIPIEMVIEAKSTIRIGSFASDLELTPSGHRAVVPVRGEKTVFVVDLNTDNPNEPVFQCGQGSDLRCDSNHKISQEHATLPLEPYEVATLEYGNYTLGFSTHPYDGDVSLFIIDENDVTRAELLAVSYNVVWGASGIAVKPNPDNYMYSDIFVTGRHDLTPSLWIMRVLSDSQNGSITNPYFNEVDYITIFDEVYGGSNARGVAVTKAGDYAYVVTRSPEALIQIDLIEEHVANMVSLGYASEPSIVSLYEYEGDPDDDFDDLVFAFVLCFLRDQVYVIETDMMMQPHVLNTGASPHALTFDYAEQKALVANFRESTISLYDVDPPNRKFTYTTVTPMDSDISARVKIGVPDLPEGHN